MLLLQEFDFNVDVRLGNIHAHANFLSCLRKKINPKSINDDILDAQLFNSKCKNTSEAPLEKWAGSYSPLPCFGKFVDKQYLCEMLS